MGFFDRLANLWRGMTGMFLRRAEEGNPEAVFEAAIAARKKRRDELIKAVSNIVYLRNKVSDETSALEQEQADLQARLPRAVEQGDDTAALALIKRDEEITARLGELRTELDRVSGQADEAKNGLAELEEGIRKLMRERDEVLAARETASARIAVQDSLSDLSVEADVQALDSVRESVKKLQAQADVRSELHQGSTAAVLERNRVTSRDAAAADKLAEMKRAMAARQAASESASAVKKTM